MRDGLALLVALALIPLVWSGAIYTAKALFMTGAPDDRMEKRILVVMLAPVLTATLLLAWAGIAPAGETVGVARLDTYLMPVVISGPAVEAGMDWARTAILALAGLYVCGFAFGAIRLLAARKRLRRLALQGARHPGWHDVVLVDMPTAAFADGRGTIVLSCGFTDAVGPEEVALAVAHERAHIRRGDPRYFGLLAWLEVVFWFNPFLRAQSRICRLAAEVACDAAVIAAAPSMRKAYASTIVAALQHAAGDALACAPAAISPRNLGDHGMRIGEIMSPSPRRGKRAAWALAFAAILAVPAGAVQLAYAQAASGKSSFMVLPLSGHISAPYGQMVDPFDGKTRFHEGVDIKAREGADIVAPAAGRVVHAIRNYQSYGNFLEIDHGDGLVTRYTHLQSIEVKDGDRVIAGQLIARVGSTGRSTGPHLHLQVMRNGKSINPAEVFALKKS